MSVTGFATRAREIGKWELVRTGDAEATENESREDGATAVHPAIDNRGPEEGFTGRELEVCGGV